MQVNVKAAGFFCLLTYAFCACPPSHQILCSPVLCYCFPCSVGSPYESVAAFQRAFAEMMSSRAVQRPTTANDNPHVSDAAFICEELALACLTGRLSSMVP